MNPFWRSYFSNGLVQPPTSFVGIYNHQFQGTFFWMFFLTYRVRHGKFEGPNPPPKFTEDSRQFPFRMAHVKGQAVAFSEYTFSERIPYIPTWEEENNLQQRRLVGDVWSRPGGVVLQWWAPTTPEMGENRWVTEVFSPSLQELWFHF